MTHSPTERAALADANDAFNRWWAGVHRIIHDKSPHDGFVAGYLAALRHNLSRASDWQPIDTAPKDGTRILVCVDDESPPWMVVCFWGELPGRPAHWRVVWDHEALGEEPTHWMPLPAAPSPRSLAGGTPSDGAIYAEQSRKADPEGYDKLLPCPFCGGEVALEEDGYHLAIGCCTIGCAGEEILMTEHGRKQAIERWNTRALRHDLSRASEPCWNCRGEGKYSNPNAGYRDCPSCKGTGENPSPRVNAGETTLALAEQAIERQKTVTEFPASLSDDLVAAGESEYDDPRRGTPPIATPLSYRTHRFDDWGLIRDANDLPFAALRIPFDLTDDDLNKHRRDKTDPCEARARQIIDAVNAAAFPVPGTSGGR